MKYNEKVLTCSVVFGLIAIICGSLGLYTEFASWTKESLDFISNPDYTREMDPSTNNLLYWSGGAGMILGEMLLSLCFIPCALLMIRSVDRGSPMRQTIVSVGILRIFISLVMFLIFFKNGWYYVLENNRFGLLVLMGGLAQGISFLFAKKE